MNLNRLFHTTAIRIGLHFAIIYALLTGMGLTVLYWTTSRYVDAQITAGLMHDLAALVKIDQEQRGHERLVEILGHSSDISVENRRYLLLVSPKGEKIAGDLKGWPPKMQPDQQVRNVWIEDDLIPVNSPDQDGYWPMIGATLPDGNRLLIAQSVQQAEDLQEFMLGAMGILLAAIVVLTLILGLRMGMLLVKRVDAITNTARRIVQGELNSRIPSSGHNDEFDELASHLNQMLAHIERLVKSMREVTDNVAHDLRRPLSHLRNRLEVTLLEARHEQDYRQAIEQAITDSEDIIRTFNSLLEIAQAEARSYRGELENLNFSALTLDIGELYQASAEDNGQRMIITVNPDIHIRGNRYLLGQAISNLLENAINYSGSNSEIALSLTIEKGHPLLSVSDSGPGIPASEYHHVLQRFVRLDTARSTPGNGLGLSLIAAVSEFHGAKLALYENHPGLRAEIEFDSNTLPDSI